MPLNKYISLCACLWMVSACASGNTFNSAADLGLIETAAQAGTPLPTKDPIYANLPEGPRNTGSFQTFGNEPVARITDFSQGDTNQMIAELSALEAGHRAGTISTIQYRARLKALERLAQRHSPNMLNRIKAQAAEFEN